MIMEDLAQSNVLSYSFQKPLVRSEKNPSARGGSTSVLADGKMVVFGGTFLGGTGGFEYVNETWLFDTESVKWHKITCAGQIPGPRYGHAAHIFGSRMFIFGGKGPKGLIYDDVFFLDLVEWVWVPVKPVSRGPSARFNFASEIVGRKMVIHGGWDGEELFGDTWILNTDSFMWIQPKTTGFAPTPRYGHTLTLTVDGRLLIFGGCSIAKDPGSIPRYQDDIRQLDTKTMIWSRPRVEGPGPTGRYGHCAALTGPGRTDLVIYGGWGRGGCQSQDYISDTRAFPLHVLNTKAMKWSVPRRATSKPVKNYYSHCASLWGDSALVIFGGCDGQQSTQDLIVLDLVFNNETDYKIL